MRSLRFQLLFLFFSCLITLSSASACIWDSNTIKDELSRQNLKLFELISNQFPEHSEAFYKRQVEKSLKVLKEDPSNRVARNDLGAAYTKLGEYDKALAEFHRLDKEKPNTYETLSNLGVLHKKMGQFDKAAEYIARALKIKPEGHMGLGDWYLRMLRYQSEVSKSKGPLKRSFLGEPDVKVLGRAGLYELEKIYGDREFLVKQLKALILNDRHFPDTYFVLGDILRRGAGSEAHLNLAFWCYVRAYDLGHKNRKDLIARMRSLHGHWTEAITEPGVDKYVVSFEETLKDVRRQLKERESWLTQFKKVEAELIEKGQEVDFEIVDDVLAERNIRPKLPEEAGIKSPSLSEETPHVTEEKDRLLLNSLAIAAVLLVLGLIYKSLRMGNRVSHPSKNSKK